MYWTGLAAACLGHGSNRALAYPEDLSCRNPVQPACASQCALRRSDVRPLILAVPTLQRHYPSQKHIVFSISGHVGSKTGWLVVPYVIRIIKSLWRSGAVPIILLIEMTSSKERSEVKLKTRQTHSITCCPARKQGRFRKVSSK